MRKFLALLAIAAAALFFAPSALATESTIVAQTMDINGLDVALAAADAGGSKFINPSDQRTFVICANSNGSTRTVTAVVQQSSVSVPGYGSIATANQDSVVPITTGLTLIGPFPQALYNDSSGYAHITFNAVTGLTCAVVRLVSPAG